MLQKNILLLKKKLWHKLLIIKQLESKYNKSLYVNNPMFDPKSFKVISRVPFRNSLLMLNRIIIKTSLVSFKSFILSKKYNFLRFNKTYNKYVSQLNMNKKLLVTNGSQKLRNRILKSKFLLFYSKKKKTKFIKRKQINIRERHCYFRIASKYFLKHTFPERQYRCFKKNRLNVTKKIWNKKVKQHITKREILTMKDRSKLYDILISKAIKNNKKKSKATQVTKKELNLSTLLKMILRNVRLTKIRRKRGSLFVPNILRLTKFKIFSFVWLNVIKRKLLKFSFYERQGKQVIKRDNFQRSKKISFKTRKRIFSQKKAHKARYRLIKSYTN